MYLTYFMVFVFINLAYTSQDNKDDKIDSEKWKKKDVRDYTDADLEKLLDQWEVFYCLHIFHWSWYLAILVLKLDNVVFINFRWIYCCTIKL